MRKPYRHPWFLSFIHSGPIPGQSVFFLWSSVQNLSTSHHSHCYGLSRSCYPVLPVLLHWPPPWPLSFHHCPFPPVRLDWPWCLPEAFQCPLGGQVLLMTRSLPWSGTTAPGGHRPALGPLASLLPKMLHVWAFVLAVPCAVAAFPSDVHVAPDSQVSTYMLPCQSPSSAPPPVAPRSLSILPVSCFENFLSAPSRTWQMWLTLCFLRWNVSFVRAEVLSLPAVSLGAEMVPAHSGGSGSVCQGSE